MKKINFDKLITLMAIIVSAATLFMIVYQTNLIQKQQAASVLPYLEVWNTQPNDSTYKLVLVNNGVGPAFIESVSVIYQDSSYPGDLLEFYKKVIIKSDTIEMGHSNVKKGILIPAGMQRELIYTRT